MSPYSNSTRPPTVTNIDVVSIDVSHPRSASSRAVEKPADSGLAMRSQSAPGNTGAARGAWAGGAWPMAGTTRTAARITAATTLHLRREIVLLTIALLAAAETETVSASRTPSLSCDRRRRRGR